MQQSSNLDIRSNSPIDIDETGTSVGYPELALLGLAVMTVIAFFLR